MKVYLHWFQRGLADCIHFLNGMAGPVETGCINKICNPIQELAMTRREKTAPLSIEGMTNGEFGVASVTVIREVWKL